MRRTSLRDRDLHAGTVDLLCGGRCRSGARDIAVVHFHECHAESEVFCASWIACSEPDVPVIGRETFVVARGIVVGLEFDRHAETRSERAGNGDGNPAEGAVGTAGHQNRIGGDKSDAQLAGRR